MDWDSECYNANLLEEGEHYVESKLINTYYGRMWIYACMETCTVKKGCVDFIFCLFLVDMPCRLEVYSLFLNQMKNRANQSAL